MTLPAPAGTADPARARPASNAGGTGPAWTAHTAPGRPQARRRAAARGRARRRRGRRPRPRPAGGVRPPAAAAAGRLALAAAGVVLVGAVVAGAVLLGEDDGRLGARRPRRHRLRAGRHHAPTRRQPGRDSARRRTTPRVARPTSSTASPCPIPEGWEKPDSSLDDGVDHGHGRDLRLPGRRLRRSAADGRVVLASPRPRTDETSPAALAEQDIADGGGRGVRGGRRRQPHLRRHQVPHRSARSPARSPWRAAPAIWCAGGSSPEQGPRRVRPVAGLPARRSAREATGHRPLRLRRGPRRRRRSPTWTRSPRASGRSATRTDRRRRAAASAPAAGRLSGGPAGQRKVRPSPRYVGTVAVTRSPSISCSVVEPLAQLTGLGVPEPHLVADQQIVGGRAEQRRLHLAGPLLRVVAQPLRQIRHRQPVRARRTRRRVAAAEHRHHAHARAGAPRAGRTARPDAR